MLVTISLEDIIKIVLLAVFVFVVLSTYSMLLAKKIIYKVRGFMERRKNEKR